MNNPPKTDYDQHFQEWFSGAPSMFLLLSKSKHARETNERLRHMAKLAYTAGLLEGLWRSNKPSTKQTT